MTLAVERDAKQQINLKPNKCLFKTSKAVIKQIKVKNKICSLTHKQGRGVNLTSFLDSLYIFLYYLPNIFKWCKSSNKGDKSQKTQNLLIYGRATLIKGQRSNISMWENFPTPKVYEIKVLFKGYDNVAAAASVGKLNMKTNKHPFQGMLNSTIKQ